MMQNADVRRRRRGESGKPERKPRNAADSSTALAPKRISCTGARPRIGPSTRVSRSCSGERQRWSVGNRYATTPRCPRSFGNMHRFEIWRCAPAKAVNSRCAPNLALFSIGRSASASRIRASWNEHVASTDSAHKQKQRVDPAQTSLEQGIPSEKPLLTRERDTVLKMLSGMALAKYGYDPKATRDIRDNRDRRRSRCSRRSLSTPIRSGSGSKKRLRTAAAKLSKTAIDNRTRSSREFP